MAIAPRAGIDSGRTSLMNVWRADAPSIAADFEQVARQLRHEVVEQEDRQRQAEARMGQPDAEERAVQVPGAVDLQDRDQRHLDRHDQQCHHDREQDAAAAERDPGEGIRGERGDGDRDGHRRDGHDQAVDERVAHAVAVDDRLVVRQRPLVGFERVEQRCPPAGRRDVLRIAHRGDQQAERRDRPQQADQEDRQAERHAPDEGRPPGGHACLRLLDGLGGRCHASLCCRLKLRRLMYITGRTAMNSRVASAAPRPSSKNWKISWNIRLATTSSPNRPPVVT